MIKQFIGNDNDDIGSNFSVTPIILYKSKMNNYMMMMMIWMGKITTKQTKIFSFFSN